MLIKRKESKEFEKVKAGMYDAVCYMICDLGTQNSGVDDEGKEIQNRKVRIGFELVDNIMQDGSPFVVSKEYTASTHEKSRLRKDLISWRGKEFTDEEIDCFDLSSILQKPCQIQIVEVLSKKTNKSYAVIQNILPKNKNFKFEKLHNEIIDFDLDNFDNVIFEKIYPFLKEKIKLSPEYQLMK